MPLQILKNIVKKLAFPIKLLVTIALSTLIIWKGDWGTIWKALQSSDPFLILCVFASMVFCVTISAFKWQLLLSIHGIHIDFGKLHKYYFTALFFNNFFPTNIGGDGYRIYKTLQNQHTKAGAIISVFTERLTGIWALIILALIGGMVLSLQESTNIPWLGGALGVFAALIVLPLIFLLFSRGAVNWLLTKKTFPWKIRKTFEHFGDYRRQMTKSLQVILISIFFHLFTLSWMLILIRAIGAKFSIYKLVIAVTVSNLAAMLPISINGIGLMDGSFIYVAGRLGLNYEPALMVMLLIRALVIPLSLIGGLFYLGEKRSLSLDDLRKEHIKSIGESVS